MGQVVKTCFGIMNIFDQSINAILLKLMSWVMKLTISCKHLIDTWHATSSSLKIESLLVTINHKSKWYFLILNFKSFKHININLKIIIYLPKIEQVAILTIVTKPWCHLQLHSNLCDQTIINIVKKDNSFFLNWSENPRCVVQYVPSNYLYMHIVYQHNYGPSNNAYFQVPIAFSTSIYYHVSISSKEFCTCQVSNVIIQAKCSY